METFQMAKDSTPLCLSQSYILPEDKRPQLSKVSTLASIPIIDLSVDHINKDGPSQILLDKITEACEEYGFFQITNHGVPQNLCERMLTAASDLFKLPPQERSKFFSADRTKEATISNFYLKFPNQDKVTMWSENFRHPWDPNGDFITFLPENLHQYREVSAEYAKEINKLMEFIFGLISQSLGLEKNCLQSRLGEKPRMKAQANFYPPCPDPELTLGLAVHTDLSALTVLMQSEEVSGLQVIKDGNWVDVKPVPNAFVVNLGDQLQQTTFLKGPDSLAEEISPNPNPRKRRKKKKMASTNIPKLVLGSSSSGPRSMPVIGLGTASDVRDPTTLKRALLEAIELGYRHFDTASVYGSEQGLGEAIAEALKLGLVASRDELFITTKLWCTDCHPHLVLPSLKASLGKLQLEYLDLYLIHWPITAKPGSGVFPIDEKDLMPMDFKSVWAAMEECQTLGLTKSIGVSNFSCKKLESILSSATIPPSVNQVEMNPTWQQKKLREFCGEKNIVVTAYSPLGAKGTRWGSNHVLENEVLIDIARARGKTVAQVSLRWIYEQGASFVVKSYNKERLKENLDIFDWALTEDDLQKINLIPQNRFNLCEAFVSPHGPYKSIEELWDGEI